MICSQHLIAVRPQCRGTPRRLYYRCTGPGSGLGHNPGRDPPNNLLLAGYHSVNQTGRTFLRLGPACSRSPNCGEAFEMWRERRISRPCIAMENDDRAWVSLLNRTIVTSKHSSRNGNCQRQSLALDVHLFVSKIEVSYRTDHLLLVPSLALTFSRNSF